MGAGRLPGITDTLHSNRDFETSLHLHDVVEDVVASLQGLLVGDSGLLKKVNLEGVEVGGSGMVVDIPPCQPLKPCQTG